MNTGGGSEMTAMIQMWMEESRCKEEESRRKEELWRLEMKLQRGEARDRENRAKDREEKLLRKCRLRLRQRQADQYQSKPEKNL